jgi:hypothetical protein
MILKFEKLKYSYFDCCDTAIKLVSQLFHSVSSCCSSMCWCFRDDFSSMTVQLTISGASRVCMDIVNAITTHKPTWIKPYDIIYTFDTLEEAEKCVQVIKSFVATNAPGQHVGFDLCYVYSFENTEQAQKFNQTKLNNEGFIES